jgi:S-adenosyl-L-methionine hydrolase (adenosine-forming)
MMRNFSFFVLLITFFCFELFSQNKTEINKPIALITDYGTKDFYVGALKGSILKINPNARIIDITHEIKSFDIREGMFTTLLATQEFPAGTIFITIVDPGVGTFRRPILLETSDGKIFIGPDNGLLTMVMDKFGVKKVIEITNKDYFRKDGVSKSFHGRDIFGPVAAYVSAGASVESCGKEVRDYIRIPIQNPKIKENKISGEVIFIDKYGNIQFNIGAYSLTGLNINLGDNVRIKIGNKSIECAYVTTYGDMEKGKFVLFESSTYFLELAVNENSAEKHFNAKLGDSVEIEKVK